MSKILTGHRTPGALPMLVVVIARPDGLNSLLPTREVPVLVDTGASHTMVRSDVLAAINVPLTNRQLPITGANAAGSAGTAWIAIGIVGDPSPNQASVVIDPIEVAVSPTLFEAAILGWDVLKNFDLYFSRDGSFSLRWS